MNTSYLDDTQPVRDYDALSRDYMRVLRTIRECTRDGKFSAVQSIHILTAFSGEYERCGTFEGQRAHVTRWMKTLGIQP